MILDRTGSLLKECDPVPCRVFSPGYSDRSHLCNSVFIRVVQFFKAHTNFGG